jgi:sulfite dehydrogenase (quinone) subunit SoeC
MHPAYSVIFFTTATGAGYGLIALLGLLAGFGLVRPDFWFGMVSFGLAFALIGAGLLSSTGHLGHPERAWRAFSQWRSSWLSREGVAAVLTFVPISLLALGWVVLGRTGGWVTVIGLITALCAAITVSSTAMIYASLKPISQWHSHFTLPGYLLYSATSGLVLLNAILQVFARPSTAWMLTAILFTLFSWGWKRATWRHNDEAAMPADLNSATGLVEGTVRSIEWPHTEENYVLKEMGFRVARKHQEKLRTIVQLAAFAAPAALLVLTLVLGGVFGVCLSILAAASQLAGLLVERWLFFAEAKHTVSLYYGRA